VVLAHTCYALAPTKLPYVGLAQLIAVFQTKIHRGGLSEEESTGAKI